jgi:hypothetical protein
VRGIGRPFDSGLEYPANIQQISGASARDRVANIKNPPQPNLH